MLSGFAVLVPATLAYNTYGFWVFRGKVKADPLCRQPLAASRQRGSTSNSRNFRCCPRVQKLLRTIFETCLEGAWRNHSM